MRAVRPRLESFLEPRGAPQGLGALLGALVLEASMLAGRGRRRSDAGFRRDARLLDERREARECLASIGRLGAMRVGCDEHRALGGEAVASQTAQPRLHLRRERTACGKVEAQL